MSGAVDGFPKGGRNVVVSQKWAPEHHDYLLAQLVITVNRIVCYIFPRLGGRFALWAFHISQVPSFPLPA